MPADFGYINARVRGLKSKLLGSDFFNEALAASDFSAFSSALQGAPAYMREVEEAGSRYSGLRAVDDAVARNFYHTTRSILDFSSGNPGELIALLLLRYDLQNLKAIARAKHADREADAVREVLLPAGELKPALLESMITAEDLPAVAQMLGVTQHPLSSAFSKATTQYASDGDLYAFELTLDRAYYTALFAELKRRSYPEGLERYLRREVDATNIRTALKVRGRSGDQDTSELYVPEGKEVKRSDFEAIVADEGEGLQVLASTKFAAVIDSQSLSEAEEAIRAVLNQEAHRLALRDPLDVGVVVDYLRRKEAEAAKVRLLARGKFYGVPNEALEKELGDA